MGRPEESKILPTHSVALTIPFKPLRAGIVFSKGFHDSRVLNSIVQIHVWGVFWIPLVCILVTFFTYAKVFWMVRTRV